MRFPVVAILSAAVAFGQTQTATIYGLVSDGAGKTISGAKVRAVNQQSGDASETTASSFGIYIFGALPPGTYTLSTEPEGFRKAETAGVKVEAGARIGIDLQPAPLNAQPGRTGSVPEVQAKLARAKELALQRRWPELQAAAEDLLRGDPGNEEAHLLVAAAQLNQGKSADALRTLEALLAANPKSAAAWLQIGIVRLSTRQFNDAEEAFLKAQALDPRDERGLAGRIEVLLARNEPDAAVGLARAAVEKWPGRPGLHMLLGNTAVRAGQYDLAVSTYGAVLAGIDPKNTAATGDLQLRIGEALRRKGDTAGAIAALEKARDAAPRNQSALMTLALVYDAAGRKTDAARTYRQVLQADPRNPIVLNNLAYLMADSGGDLDEALALVERARQIMPDNPQLADTLGWVQFRRKQYDAAAAAFREALKKNAAGATIHYHLGLALLEQGEKAEARREFEEALKHNPADNERERIEAALNPK